MPSRTTKTLAQQLHWQLILAGIAFSIAIIVSLTFITWRSVEFAADSVFKMEAHNLLKQLEHDPDLALPDDISFQAYRDWDSIPSKLRQSFSLADIENNRVYENEFINEAGQNSYVSLVLLSVNNRKPLYFLSVYNVKETNEIIDSILSNLLTDALWLLIFIFFLLFCLVFWLLKRTSEPMKLLSDWAFKLKDNDHLSKEEFPIAELNDLAAQLKTGVDRITEYNIREQQFLKHASHEMRTPLATIQACLDTLDFQLTGPEKKTVQRALKASSNMNRLSSALLWLARESEKPIEKTKIELKSFCLHQIEEHQYLLKHRDIAIDAKVDDECIDVEEELLLIVFANLLRNACQFTSQGTIKVSMDAASLRIENPIDDGLHDSGSSYQSFGLGLQLVSRICEKLNWSFYFKEHPHYVEVSVTWEKL